MKPFLSIILVMTIAVFASPAFASPGHGHGHDEEKDHHDHDPISATDAGNKATMKIQKLIEAGKIDESWSSVKVNDAKKKSFSKGDEWVISFKNSTISDAKKQTLYFFYSMDGHYIAANYSGK